jgi:4-hydroxythreonine-4-phosphate dehydrogenase
MFLVSDDLRVAVVTGHIPVTRVAQELSSEKILKKIQLLNKSLTQDFAIRKPKIAVLGLNPHAGDNGVIGDEEKNIIIPAIEKAKAEEIIAYGPYPADGFFGNGTYKNFDAVLAMYHDQGLIPFKTIAFNKGVNYTAGLPIVRTSPDHGTAYDIAGKGIASEESFRRAIYTAIDIYRTRKNHAEITSNPLKINPIKRER